MLSTSIKMVLNTTPDTVWAPNVMRRAVFVDHTSLSQNPPKWVALGGLEQNRICSVASWSRRAGSRALNALWSSLLPPWKLVPWSNKSSKGFPLRAMKCQSDIKKESASILARRSRWTAWVVRCLYRMPHLFSVRRPTLTSTGPCSPFGSNRPESFKLERGKSTILVAFSWSFHFLHSRQSCWCFLTASLPLNIQYFLRHPAPGWWTWLSQWWI